MKYSVVIPENLQEQLRRHLIRRDGQEDLCFALYNPSEGRTRYTAAIKEVILPLPGERQVHGNVSFNSEYYDRVCSLALEKGCGICFLHSHPGPGWQGMSRDDIEAEKMLAPRVKATTGISLLGMTTGNDETWSARFWIKKAPSTYERKWCATVRVVGKGFKIHFHEQQMPAPTFGKEFTRTVSAWGSSKQGILSRLKVGIVGLGSVGSIVAEALYKTGIRNISFIDFDLVELKNLDRLQGIGRKSIGRLKVDVVKKRLLKQKLFERPLIETFPYSIIEEEGFRRALDCDILFCCVDRPWPRYILNVMGYANGIPVIDGGIETAINQRGTNLDYARWKAHTVGPGRICLNCLGQYKSEDVALEQSGLLEDPTYIKNLPKDHFINRGENVFAFSLGVAGMEMQQFLSLVLQPRGQYYGPKEFDFNSGNIDFDFPFHCSANCRFPLKVSEGEKENKHLIESHPLAEQRRREAKRNSPVKAFFNQCFKFNII
jgi:hypothetical protein